jgi:hypothetical protein
VKHNVFHVEKCLKDEEKHGLPAAHGDGQHSKGMDE